MYFGDLVQRGSSSVGAIAWNMETVATWLQWSHQCVACSLCLSLTSMPNGTFPVVGFSARDRRTPRPSITDHREGRIVTHTDGQTDRHTERKTNENTHKHEKKQKKK